MTRRVAGVVADSGPVLVLASIAAAGSFSHIRDTATGHGQDGWMAWAIAVCIDLTCVMAARERQRDKRTRRETARLSWPTLVLVGGILLSLAANLAQADPSVWGWVMAATPAGAFLVAVSMLERRKAATPAAVPATAPNLIADGPAVPSSYGGPSPSSTPPVPSPPSSPWVVWEADRPEGGVTVPSVPADTSDPNRDQDGQDHEGQDGQTTIPVPVSQASDEESAGASPAAPLVAFARRVAAEHHTAHGRPITRDALRARLGVSNQLASDLLRHIRTETAPVA
ncbi:DUF2637 domain-containing protein [Actinomadura macra]|uniref:DUF2637 domain-containing protein n=1 Tax=Actinomadura macra TaxID=46164 RepID=UPI0008308133|nr:DUF2637 domain-containing protein [Actinomadura macra]